MTRTDKDWAKLALSLMDLTSLEDNDSAEKIRALCQDATTPFGHTAAVCVYAPFVGVAKQALADTAVRVATVANFPRGGEDIRAVEKEIQAQVAASADEIDVVLPYRALLAGNEALAAELVSVSKAACGDKLLKVIIESGELQTSEWIKRASEIAIDNGADFIKTSTGKVPVNATLEAADVMLRVIKDSGRAVGFKAAGGVRSVADAKAYLQLAESIMGAEWIDACHFRFGASGLLNSLLTTLNGEQDSEHSGY